MGLSGIILSMGNGFPNRCPNAKNTFFWGRGFLFEGEAKWWKSPEPNAACCKKDLAENGKYRVKWFRVICCLSKYNQYSVFCGNRRVQGKYYR